MSGALEVLCAAIDASPEPVGLGVDGRHVYANRRYAELFGYADAAEIVGKGIAELAAPSTRDVVARNVERRGRGEPAPQTYRATGLRPDGSTFDCELNVI